MCLLWFEFSHARSRPPCACFVQKAGCSDLIRGATRYHHRRHFSVLIQAWFFGVNARTEPSNLVYTIALPKEHLCYTCTMRNTKRKRHRKEAWKQARSTFHSIYQAVQRSPEQSKGTSASAGVDFRLFAIGVCCVEEHKAAITRRPIQHRQHNAGTTPGACSRGVGERACSIPHFLHHVAVTLVTAVSISGAGRFEFAPTRCDADKLLSDERCPLTKRHGYMT